MEIWAEVPDTGGFYSASTHGQVRRNAGVASPVTGKVFQEKILLQTPNGDGHLQVGVFGKLQTVHKLVYTAHMGPVPAGQLIRHFDDVKSNNWLSNLVAGSQSDNMRDAVRNGARLGGLPKATKDEIKAWVLSNPTSTYMECYLFAQKLGVSPKTVRRYLVKSLI